MPKNKRWQYQIKADVVFSGELITPDKWYAQAVNPMRPEFRPYYYPYIDYRELSIPFVPPAFQQFFDNYMRIEDY